MLILSDDVKNRTTYHSRDSRFTSMKDAGATGSMAGCLLSKEDADLKQLLDLAAGRLKKGVYSRESLPGAFTGSNYIEAHIHGEVDLARDLAGISLHCSYKDTSSGKDAEAMALKFGVPLTWYGEDAYKANTDGFLVP